MISVSPDPDDVIGFTLFKKAGKCGRPNHHCGKEDFCRCIQGGCGSCGDKYHCYYLPIDANLYISNVVEKFRKVGEKFGAEVKVGGNKNLM